jgi:hypothetical protein
VYGSKDTHRGRIKLKKLIRFLPINEASGKEENKCPKLKGTKLGPRRFANTLLRDIGEKSINNILLYYYTFFLFSDKIADPPI